MHRRLPILAILILLFTTGCLTDTSPTPPTTATLPPSTHSPPPAQTSVDRSCTLDADCDFYYPDLSADNPCPPCNYADSPWMCVNKDDAARRTRAFYDSIPDIACEECFQPDWDQFTCRCIQGTCSMWETEGNEQFGDDSEIGKPCSTAVDCRLPMSYAIISRCPYEMQCINETCQPVCPWDENETIL